MPDILAKLADLFATRGASQYGGEAVTQLEHALQAAWCAEQAGAAPAVIAAALLHDVGHLIHPHGEDAADRGIDDHHEALGSRFLARHFGPEVIDPIRFHVDAKRYLSTAEPGYFDTLSPASVTSLRLQGGPMTPAEAEEFRQHPRFEAIIAVRRWDEAAKVPGLSTPPFAHFVPYLETCLARG